MKEQLMNRIDSPLRKAVRLALFCAAALGGGRVAAAADGFVSLFNGRDLSGWKIPVGDNGHWKVVGGVIDIDARSEATGDKSLWSEKEFGDFVLRVEWRIKETPYINPNVPIVKPDGSEKKGLDGKTVQMAAPDAGRQPPRGTERGDGHRAGAPARGQGPGADRSPAPWGVEGRQVGEPAPPRPVPQHRDQGASRETLASVRHRPFMK